jgi:signal transduction histidine kinase
MTTSPPHNEDGIARCRLVLSVTALAAVFVDPTEPLLSHWVPLTSGHFVIDPYVLIVMGAHLLYSSVIYLGLSRNWFLPARMIAATTWCDITFSAAIAFLTEGISSPFYPFFAFAVVVAGFRAGLRPTLIVTGISVALYLCLIVVSAAGSANLYIMRPVYLAITGYLVGYLGQQRLDLQEEIHQLEAAEQRHRIARDLHDGFAQALAGINLRIEGCRRSLQAHREGEAFTDLTELQESVNREYDELRDYMRALAGVGLSSVSVDRPLNTRLVLKADLAGSIGLVDHVLQIAREGISNVRRHAQAASATIQINADGARVHISIADDGVGLPTDTTPWSIVSRVKELGGQIQVNDPRPGAHLLIMLPQS